MKQLSVRVLSVTAKGERGVTVSAAWGSAGNTSASLGFTCHIDDQPRVGDVLVVTVEPQGDSE